MHPEENIYGEDEKKRFISYLSGIDKEESLQEIWKWYGEREIFSFDVKKYIRAARDLLSISDEECARCLDLLHAPVILQEIISAIVYPEKDNNLIYRLLENAPDCVDTDEKGKCRWNSSSYAAPTILDLTYIRLTVQYPINECSTDDEGSIKIVADKIGQILNKRKDGLFLASEYIKYLLSVDKKNRMVTKAFIDTLGEKCTSAFDNYYEGKEPSKQLRPKKIQLSDMRKKFTYTGLLEQQQKDSMYLNMLVQMQFRKPEILKGYVPCFEDSMKFLDDKMRAFDPHPLLCHEYIADMYLACENPVKTWENSWGEIKPAQYRSWFNRYDKYALGLERQQNFLLLVGIAMMEKMYVDEMNPVIICSMWNVLWKIIQSVTYRCGNGKNSEIRKRIERYIIAWRLLILKIDKNEENAMKDMTDFLLTYSWHPRQFLSILAILISNKYKPWQYLSEDISLKFKNKVIASAEYAIALKRSERRLGEMGEYIKKWAK